MNLISTSSTQSKCSFCDSWYVCRESRILIKISRKVQMNKNSSCRWVEWTVYFLAVLFRRILPVLMEMSGKQGKAWKLQQGWFTRLNLFSEEGLVLIETLKERSIVGHLHSQKIMIYSNLYTPKIPDCMNASLISKYLVNISELLDFTSYKWNLLSVALALFSLSLHSGVFKQRGFVPLLVFILTWLLLQVSCLTLPTARLLPMGPDKYSEA